MCRYVVAADEQREPFDIYYLCGLSLEDDRGGIHSDAMLSIIAQAALDVHSFSVVTPVKCIAIFSKICYKYTDVPHQRTGEIVGEIEIGMAITVQTLFRFGARRVIRVIDPQIKEMLEQDNFSRVIFHYPERISWNRFEVRVTVEIIGSESRSHDLEAGTKVLLSKLESARKSVLSTAHQRSFYQPVSATGVRPDEFAAYMLMTGGPEEADLRPSLVGILMRKGESEPSN